MLIGVDPLLSGDLLQVLRDLGHGDVVCIADCNFPGFEIARKAGVPWLRMDCDAPRAVQAVLSVMPLDSFVDEAVHRMEDAADPAGLNEAHRAVKSVMEQSAGSRFRLGGIERFAFYEAAAKSAVVVQTLERRGYACFLLKKGVIGLDGQVI
ncbi:MAG: fucose-binding protein [Geminicoccaceae bacterium]|nr:fucose-binding protein [Geminicoccaceae bacterium]